MEALALARHADHTPKRGQPEGGRAVLPLRPRDGHEEGRPHAHRPLRRTVRRRREPAEALRSVVCPQRRRPALSVRGRQAVQRVEVHPEVLVLVRAGEVPALHSHGDATAAHRGTLLRARLRRLVHGLCASARRL